jgi:Mg2+-importing ATPase
VLETRPSRFQPPEFDFLTFWALLTIFRGSEAHFHTGWFVESLATQALVLFVIRTASNPLRSRPSLPLAVTVLLVVLVGGALPFSPLAGPLGFTPMPAGFFLFLVGLNEQLLTPRRSGQVVKRRLMRRLGI